MMKKPHERLVDHWRATEDGLAIAGTDPADIATLERRYGVKLPSDFRAYLAVAVPAPSSGAGWPTEWWTVDRLRPMSEELEKPFTHPVVKPNWDRYLVFADYAVWCMAWAIACTEDENHGRVFVINGSDDRFVADDFSEFVDRHIADVTQIL